MVSRAETRLEKSSCILCRTLTSGDVMVQFRERRNEMADKLLSEGVAKRAHDQREMHLHASIGQGEATAETGPDRRGKE